MGTLYLVRHPETRVDLLIPSSRWLLTEEGMGQAQRLARQSFWRQVSMIYASDEPKAVTAARVVAAHTGIPWQTRSCLGELDRRRYQPPDIAAYRSAVTRMFSNPEQSIRGWETRADAEERIVMCVQELVTENPDATVAIISHGIILTILVAHLTGVSELYEFWREMGFASVAVLDTDRWTLRSSFSNAYLG
jgi:broad specificity phosphatase PhoE